MNYKVGREGEVLKKGRCRRSNKRERWKRRFWLVSLFNGISTFVGVEKKVVHERGGCRRSNEGERGGNAKEKKVVHERGGCKRSNEGEIGEGGGDAKETEGEKVQKVFGFV